MILSRRVFVSPDLSPCSCPSVVVQMENLVMTVARLWCRSPEKVRVDIQGVLAECEAVLLSFYVCDGMSAPEPLSYSVV